MKIILKIYKLKIFSNTVREITIYGYYQILLMIDVPERSTNVAKFNWLVILNKCNFRDNFNFKKISSDNLKNTEIYSMKVCSFIIRENFSIIPSISKSDLAR